MSYEQILYEVKEGVATITLNRPEVLNAWTDVIAEELWDATHKADADNDVRVMLLTGAGRAFCAGGDVTGFKSENPQQLIDKLPRSYDFSRRPDYQGRASYFPSLSKPIIAVLNGPAAGLGLVHALFCDLRFAAHDAVITTAFSRIGLASEYGMAWALKHVVGYPAAMDLLLSARKVRGEEALRLGLVNQTYSKDQLLGAAYAYARDLVENVSPRSMRVMKRQLWELPFQSLHEALISDSAEMLEANVCEDFQEGKCAFMEKRKPNFTGH
ncbi:enoyl-CoA hydratase [Aromatoleum petrolei]|uniref:Enoyl-CoA hydratase n=1 Tax=Aromatoleum petrolei TaxID=76116 RepID=A0ABX1MTY2_9RHOO|nr:enoyl-CoA hydratase [Aromatoleum petrolei]NMF88572.1 enoyl-CoA hydratase [Aromatoleum petrolei]QTQ34720.1 Enoyl-CoA hydratase/isomerase [Aromatoleum petrolei]